MWLSKWNKQQRRFFDMEWNDLVTCSYTSSVVTGHNAGNLVMMMNRGGPERLVFDKPQILKVAPSIELNLYFRSNKWRSEDLEIVTKANNIANFLEMSFKDKTVETAILSLMKEATTPTSQVVLYLGIGGCSLKTPCNRRVTKGCWPTEWPLMGASVADKADLSDLIVEYWKTEWNSHVRNSIISSIVGEKGSFWWFSNHLNHFLHADAYNFLVPFLQVKHNNWKVKVSSICQYSGDFPSGQQKLVCNIKGWGSHNGLTRRLGVDGKIIGNSKRLCNRSGNHVCADQTGAIITTLSTLSSNIFCNTLPSKMKGEKA